MLKRTNLKSSSDQVTEIPNLCDESFENLLTSLAGERTDKLTEDQIDQLKAVSPNPFYLTVIYDELAKFGHTDEHIQNILDSLNESGESIHNLFKYFVNVWSKEHGDEFTNFIIGTIAISEHGVSEVDLNEFVEWKKQNYNTHFESSFCYFYDGLQCFLNGGGFGRVAQINIKFSTNEIDDFVVNYLGTDAVNEIEKLWTEFICWRQTVSIQTETLLQS